MNENKTNLIHSSVYICIGFRVTPWYVFHRARKTKINVHSKMVILPNGKLKTNKTRAQVSVPS